MPWRPAHETHAIERVQLTLVFSEQVPTRAWQSAIDHATTLFQAQGFGQVPLIGQPVFNFPSLGGPSPQQVFFQVNGNNLDRSFILMEEGQPREEAQVSRQQIAYSANRYGSWKELSARFEAVLRSLINSSLELVSASLLKLEYWDRFFFEGPAEQVDYEQLISSRSKYIPAFYRDTRQQLHSHIGLFTRSDPSRRLINANLDVVDVAIPNPETGEATPQRSAGIYTMAQDVFVPETTPDFSSVMVVANELHTILKEVLDDIITEDMATRISLFPREDV